MVDQPDLKASVQRQRAKNPPTSSPLPPSPQPSQTQTASASTPTQVEQRLATQDELLVDDRALVAARLRATSTAAAGRRVASQQANKDRDAERFQDIQRFTASTADRIESGEGALTDGERLAILQARFPKRSAAQLKRKAFRGEARSRVVQGQRRKRESDAGISEPEVTPETREIVINGNVTTPVALASSDLGTRTQRAFQAQALALRAVGLADQTLTGAARQRQLQSTPVSREGITGQNIATVLNTPTPTSNQNGIRVLGERVLVHGGSDGSSASRGVPLLDVRSSTPLMVDDAISTEGAREVGSFFVQRGQELVSSFGRGGVKVVRNAGSPLLPAPVRTLQQFRNLARSGEDLRDPDVQNFALAAGATSASILFPATAPLIGVAGTTLVAGSAASNIIRDPTTRGLGRSLFDVSTLGLPAVTGSATRVRLGRLENVRIQTISTPEGLGATGTATRQATVTTGNVLRRQTTVEPVETNIILSGTRGEVFTPGGLGVNLQTVTRVPGQTGRSRFVEQDFTGVFDPSTSTLALRNQRQFFFSRADQQIVSFGTRTGEQSQVTPFATIEAIQQRSGLPRLERASVGLSREESFGFTPVRVQTRSFGQGDLQVTTIGQRQQRVFSDVQSLSSRQQPLFGGQPQEIIGSRRGGLLDEGFRLLEQEGLAGRVQQLPSLITSRRGQVGRGRTSGGTTIVRPRPQRPSIQRETPFIENLPGTTVLRPTRGGLFATFLDPGQAQGVSRQQRISARFNDTVRDALLPQQLPNQQSGLRSLPDQLFEPAQLQRQQPRFATRQNSLFALRQVSDSAFRPRAPGSSGFPFPSPRSPSVPQPQQPFGFGLDLGTQNDLTRSLRARGPRPRPRFSPSVFSAALGIVAESTPRTPRGGFTGFEIRPLVVRERRGR